MLDYANDKKNILGQYFTPDEIVDFCLSRFNLNKVVIEPSCGSGQFLKKLPKETKGIEIDKDVFKSLNFNNCINLDFYNYEYDLDTTKKVSFIGNPPYRTPAYSLKTNNKKVKSLAKKYNVKGVKEEVIFFILKTFDIFKKNNLEGNIGYIIPKNIFTGSSILFKTFKEFCNSNMTLTHIYDIKEKFEFVGQDLVFVVWNISKEHKECNSFLLNDMLTNIDDFWCPEEEVIRFTDIFKKTYLGSVPAESFLLSCENEPKDIFLKRLQKLYTSNVNKSNVVDLLSYNGVPHLRALKQYNPKKIERAVSDIRFWQKFISLSDLKEENIKDIQHRKQVRYYFRLSSLEKQKKFVYILNKNTKKSFYFPGNPTRTSTDYWGYCNYDINRNCSPGANRSVPVDNVKDNIKSEFLCYWKSNTNKDISYIYDYLEFVILSKWYAEYKNTHQRFYFCIPKKFLKEFNK